MTTTPSAAVVSPRIRSMNETVCYLSFIQRYVYTYLLGNDYHTAAQVPGGPFAFCCCKRKRGGKKWRTEFIVRMAEVYYPWGQKKTHKWLKNRVGSITNVINVCAAYGTPRLATEYLLKFQSRFHSFPASTPGALEYAVAHAQYEFVEEWAKVVLPGIISQQFPAAVSFNENNSSGCGAVLPSAGQTVLSVILSREWNENNRNLCVAVCMGIATLRQQLMMATRRNDNETLRCSEALMSDLVHFVVVRTPMEDKCKVKDLLEIASATGAVRVVEAILQKAPPKTQIIYNQETYALYPNAFCSAVAGGHPELCKLFFNIVPHREGCRYNRKNISTILLKAACTTTENFVATQHVIQEMFESDPLRWGTAADPPEFARQGWPQFEKSTILRAATLSAMWKIVKVLVSADFSDEDVQQSLPDILGLVARHHTEEARNMFDEILLCYQKLPLSANKLRGKSETILKSVCEGKNAAIFHSLINHPDFKALMDGPCFTELLVNTLTPPSEHFHRAYEDFIGLPNSLLASLKVKHYAIPQKEKPFEIAEALLPFLREKIRTGQAFIMNVALVQLIKKGCSSEALQWLSSNDLFCTNVIQYPVLLFEKVLSSRPESTKKGGTVHCPIGYKKLNKHIFTLQAVLTPLAQLFRVYDVKVTLYKVTHSVWPVTLYLLSIINDEFGLAAAEYVRNKFTVKMLVEAVFVDLSVSGKFFNMDGTRDLPSLFDWLATICHPYTMARALNDFLPRGGYSLLSKHPNQEGVDIFYRKANYLKPPSQDESCYATMGNNYYCSVGDTATPPNMQQLRPNKLTIPTNSCYLSTTPPAQGKRRRDRPATRKKKDDSAVAEADLRTESPHSHHRSYVVVSPASFQTSSADSQSNIKTTETIETFLVPPLPFPTPSAPPQHTSSVTTDQHQTNVNTQHTSTNVPASTQNGDTEAAVEPAGPSPKISRTNSTTNQKAL
ncbi:hypothetical protein Pelo_3252 [Pelomyxa schiedti]|nr:hypothetical protein Pelo_3252 [Pelomyxa schiedti]